MKKGTKKKGNIFAYLDSMKVLETGSEQDIARTRTEYWKGYKAQWRKKQRQETKQFTIVCTLLEAKDISESAKKHRRTRPTFIKECCLAYLDRRYVVPDLLAINHIRQLLAMNYNALQKQFDENIITHQTGTILMQQMAVMEQTMLSQLHNPKTLEQWIAETVRDIPGYKDKIIELLQKL